MEMWRNVNLQGDESPREVSASVTCLRGDASRMLVATAGRAAEYAEISILDAESGGNAVRDDASGSKPSICPKSLASRCASFDTNVGRVSRSIRENKDRKRIESFGVTRLSGQVHGAFA